MAARRLPAGRSIGKLKQHLVDQGAAKEDTVVITRKELGSLRTLIEASDKDRQAKLQKHELQKRKLDDANERKERIRQIDNQRIKKGPQVDENWQHEMKQREQVKNAKRQLDEESDEVKYMNKVMHYARCVTIRDAQIDEKKAIHQEQREEDKRLDMMMEMERLKAIKMYDEREHKRIEDRHKGAAVIRAQMEEMEQERLRQLELKQQEQEAMLRHIEKMREDDQKEAARKREASRRLMEDVALANAEQIRLKTRQKETEMEEERRITQYLRDKDKREQELAEEQERARAEKEREVARLRSMQERAQDKQAEMDALRAKRAFEAYERDWRRKEREETERAARIHRELAEARQNQKREKEAMLAEQAMIENEEFERIIAVQRAEDEIEREKRGIDRQRRLKHAQELKEQISHIDETKRKERREFIEDGVKLRKEKEERECQLAAIRAEKAAAMAAQGVPLKYRNEILRKKANEPLRPSK